MELKYIDPARQTEWENLTKANPASGFMQSFAWAELKKLLGWEIYKIGIFENDRLTGGAIISKFTHFSDFNFLQINEGPVLPYHQPIIAEVMFYSLISEIDTIANLTKPKLTSHLTIEPKLNDKPAYFHRFRKATIDQQPIKTLIIDLHLSESEILRQMKPKGRYNIKIARKHGVQIRKTSIPEGIGDFLQIYTQFIKRSKIPGKSEDYFWSLAYIYPNPVQASVYFALFENKPLCTAIVINYGDTVTFLFGAATATYRPYMANYLLHWEIMRDAKNCGYRWYDLYSLAPGDNPENHPWYGYSVFKRKFGGEEINYIGAYDYIYNQNLYQKYMKIT
jgi:peptidoglycan pentaglycine glycine transferase (the first glycine)